MKVTLLAIHQLSIKSYVPLLDCLGVLALAAAVRERADGVECDVLDLVEYGDMYQRDYQDDLEAIVDRVVQENTDVLGLSTMSNNLILALDICRRIKERGLSIHTMIGGPGVSFCAPAVVEIFEQVDAVIRGEADFVFPEYLSDLKRGRCDIRVPGLVEKRGRVTIDTGWPDPIADLDELPIPLYDPRFNHCSPENEIEKHTSVSLEAGRGCPFRCVFCSTSHYFQRRFRVKSVPRILEEVQVIQDTYGSEKTIVFNHDLLTLKQDYMADLCAALKAHTPAVHWGCSARLDCLDESLLERMRESGCERIFIGVETATPKMQTAIRKNLDLERLTPMVETLRRLDFGCTLSFIAGFPSESSDDLQALLATVFREKILDWEKVRIQIHALAPEPGSDLLTQTPVRELAYDAQGSPGTSDLPFDWRALRTVIRRHPAIFPTYFHFRNPHVTRETVLKMCLLASFIELKMTYSLQLAYKHLGERLPVALFQALDHIDCPEPDYIDNGQFLTLMAQVHEIVAGLENDMPDYAKQLEAIARYEMAVGRIMQNPEQAPELLEVEFEPNELIEQLTEKKSDPLTQRRRHLMVFWDETKKKPQYVCLPPQLAALAEAS
ncbi:MAG: radical SAM protein [Candidatus Lernaella stagnicola]|nr:radical SAM protein [Candidatus Lernaella stagnicola]